MAQPTIRTRPPSQFLKRAGACCLGVALLSLSACKPDPAEEAAEKAKQLEEFLASQGVQRVPAEPYAFPPVVDTEQLRSTVVAPDLSAELPAGKNLVYCATRKLVEAMHRRAETGLPTPASLEGVADELPEGSYRFFSGDPGEIHRQIESGSSPPTGSLDSPQDAEQGWCCHFQRSLPFAEAFEPLRSPLAFHSSSGVVRVACFGDRRYEEHSVQQTLRREQITIIDFRGEDDFVVRLNTVVKEDELILAKVPPEKSLESTLRGVMSRVKSNPLRRSTQSEIQEGEALVVPRLTVNLLDKLSGSPAGFQTVRFRLDEKGAALDSYLGYSSLGDDVVLRQMIFDKPFLLYLKSHPSETPYFALWVENLEVMEEFVTKSED